MIKLTTNYELPELAEKMLEAVQERHGLGGTYPIEEDEWFPVTTFKDGQAEHVFSGYYLFSYSKEHGQHYLTVSELTPRIQAVIAAMQKLKETPEEDG